MSRIVALLQRDRRTADRETLRKLAAPMRIRGSDEPRFRLSGPAALAFQCLQASAIPDDLQPAELGPALSICFDGRLDNREELIREYRAELTADPAALSDAFFAMACYRRHGESFAAKLNGDFALALFDADEQHMLLARDVMGTRPLYYWMSGDLLVAASEIKAILAHPRIEPRPDEDALADLLLGGNPHELRRTLFRDVRRVLPGCAVVVSPAGHRELRHWDFDPTRQVRCGSLAEYSDALRGHFEQAVRRRLRARGGVAVSVSGGLDSSAILCQAEMLRKSGAAHAPVRGVSRLHPAGSAADERRYLEHIEMQHGIEIVRLPPAPLRYSTDGAWLRSIESPAFLRNSFLECLQHARDLSCSTLLEGVYGDQILWNPAHLFDLVRGFHWLDARKEFHALSDSMHDCDPQILLKELLRPFLRELVPDCAMTLFRFARRLLGRGSGPKCYSARLRELAFRQSQQQRRPKGPFASRNAKYCYNLAHARHILIGLEMTNHAASRSGLEMAYPFADRDLIAFIMAIPGDILAWKGAFKGLFRESMRGILPEAIRLRFSKADFTQLEFEAAAELEAAGLDRNLGPGSIAVTRGYLDAAELPASIARLKAGLSGSSMWPAVHLNELLALELWLQAFFGAHSPKDTAFGLR